MRRGLPILLLFVLPGIFVPGVGAQERPVRYDPAADRFSIRAAGVAAPELLALVEQATGVGFRSTTAISGPVSITISEVPLEQGLRDLAAALGQGLAMNYDGTGRLRHVVLAPRGRGGGVGSRESLAGLDVPRAELMREKLQSQRQERAEAFGERKKLREEKKARTERGSAE